MWTKKKPGIRLLFDRWIIFHACVAAFLVNSLNANPFDFAARALFPAASILVGMAVAWTSRASAIMHDEKFRKRIIAEDNPAENYFYSYQLSLLIMITTVSYISLMAAGGLRYNFISYDISTKASGFWLYFLLSLSIRECWSIVNFSSLLSILSDRVSKSDETK